MISREPETVSTDKSKQYKFVNDYYNHIIIMHYVRTSLR